MIAVAALALGGGLALRLLYPFTERKLVFEQARANQLSPYLVAAVIRVESRWNPRATSRREARGLMQVMPETGAWVAGQIGLKGFNPDMLYDPVINVRLGTWYLAHLREEFGGDLILALAAYNGGGSNVRHWLETRQWTGEHRTLEQIPFPETRAYVAKVMRDFEWYRFIYGEAGLFP